MISIWSECSTKAYENTLKKGVVGYKGRSEGKREKFKMDLDKISKIAPIVYLDEAGIEEHTCFRS